MSGINNFWAALQPKDVIALVLAVGSLLLLLSGRNGLVGLVLVSIVAYYYGIYTPYNKKNGR